MEQSKSAASALNKIMELVSSFHLIGSYYYMHNDDRQGTLNKQTKATAI